MPMGTGKADEVRASSSTGPATPPRVAIDVDPVSPPSRAQPRSVHGLRGASPLKVSQVGGTTRRRTTLNSGLGPRAADQKEAKAVLETTSIGAVQGRRVSLGTVVATLTERIHQRNAADRAGAAGALPGLPQALRRPTTQSGGGAATAAPAAAAAAAAAAAEAAEADAAGTGGDPALNAALTDEAKRFARWWRQPWAANVTEMERLALRRHALAAPENVRQALEIDIYAARAIQSKLKVATLEQLQVEYAKRPRAVERLLRESVCDAEMCANVSRALEALHREGYAAVKWWYEIHDFEADDLREARRRADEQVRIEADQAKREAAAAKAGGAGRAPRTRPRSDTGVGDHMRQSTAPSRLALVRKASQRLALGGAGSSSSAGPKKAGMSQEIKRGLYRRRSSRMILKIDQAKITRMTSKLTMPDADAEDDAVLQEPLDPRRVPLHPMLDDAKLLISMFGDEEDSRTALALGVSADAGAASGTAMAKSAFEFSEQHKRSSRQTQLRADYKSACDLRQINPNPRAMQQLGSKEVQLNGERLGFDGIVALTSYRLLGMVVTTLDLGLNRLEREGAVALAQMLPAAAPNLRHLCLADNKMGSEGALALAAALLSLPEMATVDVARNGIDDASAAAVLLALTPSGKMEHLDVSSNACGDEAAAALAQLVATSTSLRVLQLEWNRFSAAGLQPTCDALRHRSKLERLHCGWNNLGPEGGMLLAALMGASSSLRHLSLEHNRCDAQAALLLAEGVFLNRNLTNLHMSHNPMGLVGVRAIFQAVNAKSSSHLSSFQLVNCTGDAGGVQPGGAPGSGSELGRRGSSAAAAVAAAAAAAGPAAAAVSLRSVECGRKRKHVFDMSVPFDFAFAELLRVKVMAYQAGRWMFAKLDGRNFDLNNYREKTLPRRGALVFDWWPKETEKESRRRRSLVRTKSEIHTLAEDALKDFSVSDRKDLIQQQREAEVRGRLLRMETTGALSVLLKVDQFMHEGKWGPSDLLGGELGGKGGALKRQSSRRLSRQMTRQASIAGVGGVGGAGALKSGDRQASVRDVSMKMQRQPSMVGKRGGGAADADGGGPADRPSRSLMKMRQASIRAKGFSSQRALAVDTDDETEPGADGDGDGAGAGDGDGAEPPVKPSRPPPGRRVRRGSVADMPPEAPAAPAAPAAPSSPRRRPSVAPGSGGGGAAAGSSPRRRPSFRGQRSFRGPQRQQSRGSRGLRDQAASFKRQLSRGTSAMARGISGLSSADGEPDDEGEVDERRGPGFFDVDQLTKALKAKKVEITTQECLKMCHYVDFNSTGTISVWEMDLAIKTLKGDLAYLRQRGFEDIWQFINDVRIQTHLAISVVKDLGLERDRRELRTLFRLLEDEPGIVAEGSDVVMRPKRWKNMSRDGRPVDAVPDLMKSRSGRLAFTILDGSINLHTHHSFDLSVKSQAADATVYLKKYILETPENVEDEARLSNARLNGGPFSFDNAYGARKAGANEDGTGALVALPSSGVFEFDMYPKDAYLIGIEEHQLDLSRASQRQRAEHLIARSFRKLGEGLWRVKLDGEAADVFAVFDAVPTRGFLTASYVITRPRAIAECKQVKAYEMKLEVDYERSIAKNLRGHIVDNDAQDQPIWLYAYHNKKRAHILDVTTPDLWPLPKAGALKFELMYFTTHEPVMQPVIDHLRATLETTPAVTDQMRLLQSVFRYNRDESLHSYNHRFWISSQMCSSLLLVFSYSSTKQEAYDICRRSIVDVHNCFEIENTIRGARAIELWRKVMGKEEVAW